ncbi:MAG TPA: SGNH/GDSL hydrolase family protein [Propionicimonas sp.]|jgi:lysophospholipase L1-like esterase
MRRHFVAFAATAVALTLCFGLPATTAQAKPAIPVPPNYLAVGDSITQGLGVTPAQSYPSLLDAKSRHLKLADNVALEGATVTDVGTQLSTFAGDKSKVTRISVTVGANDVGWARLLLACINLPAQVKCADIVDPTTHLTLQQLVDAGLVGLSASLPALLDAAGTMYPHASMYVGSYYELFGSKNRACVVTPASTGNPGYSISRVNKSWYNTTTRRLNATIKAAVKAANATPAGNGITVRFVNVAPSFNGHGFCDSAKRWVIAPQDIPTGGSLDSVAHPNTKGQRAYARAFWARGIR